MQLIKQLFATTSQIFGIGGTSGVKLKNNSGTLEVRNPTDSSFSNISASSLSLTNDSLVLNSDGSSGSDRSYTISRPASGMTSNLSIFLPPNLGSNGQALITDGNGNTNWGSLSPLSFLAFFTQGTTVEALTAGNLVSITNTGEVRKANNSNNLPAHGFVDTNFGLGATANIYLFGRNNNFSGLIPGSPYFLGVNGNITNTPPANTESGSFVQFVGFALSPTSLNYICSVPITIS